MTHRDEGQHKWKLPRVEDVTVLQDRTSETAEDEPGSKKQLLYRQQLLTALVLCLVAVGQSCDAKQAALALLHQLLRIEHDSLAKDTDAQGSHCMGCGIAVYVCAWKVTTNVSFVLSQQIHDQQCRYGCRAKQILG